MTFLAKGVSIRYGESEVVKDFNIEVEEGSIVALIGANGAGKTTILRGVSGLKPVFSGEFWFRGARIDGWTAPAISRHGVKYMPEGRRLFGDMTVLENLQMGAYLKNGRSTDAALDRVFERLPLLYQRKKQRAASLSGGEQQLLAMGRMIMSEPAMVLLDEPTWGLSPVMTNEIARMIVEMSQDGVGVLLVEQNARMALSIAQFGHVLEAGKVILSGNAQALMDNPAVRQAYLGI